MRTGLFAAAALLGMLAAPAWGQQSIKIGFVSTFSGPQASIGQDMRRSVELAVEHLNGKMAGKPIEVIFEDDQFKPEIGKQKSEKLVQQDKVSFVGGYIWSNVLLASLKTVTDDGDTILISSNAGPSQIAGELCTPNYFSTSWQNDQTPSAMGQFVQDKGIKKVYLVSANYAAGKDMLAGFKRTFKGEIVGEDLTKWPDQLDFSAEMSKIRAAKPDAVFVFFPGAHGVQFLSQYAQTGLKGTIPLYTAFVIDALSLPQLKDLALGVPGAQSWVADLPNAQNKKFVADFRKKYGVTPSFYGAQSYDTIMLIASAVEGLKGDISNKDKLRAELKKANFKSVRGKFSFNNNHFPIQDFYIQDAVKEADGSYGLKTVGVGMKDAKDAYGDKCPMK